MEGGKKGQERGRREERRMEGGREGGRGGEEEEDTLKDSKTLRIVCALHLLSGKMP